MNPVGVSITPIQSWSSAGGTDISALLLAPAYPTRAQDASATRRDTYGTLRPVEEECSCRAPPSALPKAIPPACWDVVPSEDEMGSSTSSLLPPSLPVPPSPFP